jgi:hypothetical protein
MPLGAAIQACCAADFLDNRQKKPLSPSSPPNPDNPVPDM